ncbi:predicted protein [Nematostella vectensis]|uniref:Uncharacterized protein n=1 Tax=Nematostella vectensis TaxID=45351 RepID=A7RX03_NEMVE|nr:predicted protein [Nematostella vectensis]|eukprot:XP_001636127.1 predicted protein [Nematostella vectensis]
MNGRNKLVAEEDINEEALLEISAESNSSKMAADVPLSHSSVNSEAGPASLTPEQVSLLTSAFQRLSEKLEDSPMGKTSKGKASADQRIGEKSECSIPAKKPCGPDNHSMSDSADCEALLDKIMSSKPSTLADSRGQPDQNTDSDDDEDLRELTKEYESEDLTGSPLKSEPLVKLFNKMFRSKVEEKALKEKMERQVRPENCANAKVARCNTGIWRKLQEHTKRRDMHMVKMQQALVKEIIPVAHVADKAMVSKSLNLDEIQQIKKSCLEALSLLTHVNYEINIQRKFLMKPDIGSEYASLCSPLVPLTDNLFGDDLQKHLKDIGDENKIGAKINKGTKGNPHASRPGFGRGFYNQNRPKKQSSRGAPYPGRNYHHKGSRQQRGPKAS